MKPLERMRWTGGGSILSVGRRMAARPELSAPRVLIVDDDPLFRKAVALILRGLCETVELSSGFELEEFLSSAPPEIVILDVNLPGRDGFALCEAMRSIPRWRATPVIFLTARKGDAAFTRCLDVCGDAFLTKPFEPDELVETVIRLLPPEDDGADIPGSSVTVVHD
jgi:CheY-like chemotaxis protein